MRHRSLEPFPVGTFSLLLLAALAQLPAQKPARLWEADPLAGEVQQYCLSPTGRRAATLGEDRQVLLWDTRADKAPPILACRLPAWQAKDGRSSWVGARATTWA